MVRASCWAEFLSQATLLGSPPPAPSGLRAVCPDGSTGGLSACVLSALFPPSVHCHLLVPLALPRAPPFHVQLSLVFWGSSWWQGQACGARRGEQGAAATGGEVRSGGGRGAHARSVRPERSVGRAPRRAVGRRGPGPGRLRGPSKGMAVAGAGGGRCGTRCPLRPGSRLCPAFLVLICRGGEAASEPGVTSFPRSSAVSAA